MKPTEKQISDKRDEAADSVHAGRNRFPRMTYQEGVRDALEWVLGSYEAELEV